MRRDLDPTRLGPVPRVRPSAQLRLPIGHTETLALQLGQIADRFEHLRESIWNIKADETQRGMALAVAQEIEQRVMQWMKSARPDVEIPRQTPPPEWLISEPSANSNGSGA